MLRFMEPISLKDMIPEQAEFTLTRKEKTYHIRPFNLADENWLQNKYGLELEQIFGQVKMVQVCEIVFHQLPLEEQEDFSAREVKTIDEQTGEKGSLRIGGGRLLQEYVVGKKEQLEIYQAVLKAVGFSRPLLEKAKAHMAAREGAAAAGKKKQTGPKSSISSPASTDGRSSKSRSSRSARSSTSSGGSTAESPNASSSRPQ